MVFCGNHVLAFLKQLLVVHILRFRILKLTQSLEDRVVNHVDEYSLISNSSMTWGFISNKVCNEEFQEGSFGDPVVMPVPYVVRRMGGTVGPAESIAVLGLLIKNPIPSA